jgi:DNA mismatch repair ATPase MutS
VANVAASAGWALALLGGGPLLVAFALGALWSYHLQSRLTAATTGLDRHSRDLGVLALMLVRLEHERFATPRLGELRAELDTSGRPASQEVAHLLRLVELKDSSRNVLFAPLAWLLLWDTQIALALEAWRRRCGPRIAGWVATIAELEALCSLAGHAFERPSDPFPELVDDGPCFDGSDLGHPLLAEAVSIRNDVRLDAALRLLLISGSNMSGKSTLLRTVGTNLVLARAGAPVRARALRVSELALGASLRTHDSLQAGRSRFYAEILRLRQIMQAASAGPLLFLLDEVLHGTNSDDRRRGAEAVVRGLLTRGAIGLVTTHDLALARVADELAPQARNVHLEDHIDHAGQIAFDYRLKEGVVQRSNAVALMRAVGLEV